MATSSAGLGLLWKGPGATEKANYRPILSSERAPSHLETCSWQLASIWEPDTKDRLAKWTSVTTSLQLQHWLSIETQQSRCHSPSAWGWKHPVSGMLYFLVLRIPDDGPDNSDKWSNWSACCSTWQNKQTNSVALSLQANYTERLLLVAEI
jgi:hypothetical protein